MRNRDSETRGTCRYCEQRCRVYVPRGGDGSARVCGHHYLQTRKTLGAKQKCPGVRTICEEDHRP